MSNAISEIIYKSEIALPAVEELCFPLPMALTLSDRMLDVERGLHVLKGYLKGAGAVAGLLILVIGGWITAQLMPTLHDIQREQTKLDQRVATIEGAEHIGNISMTALKEPAKALNQISLISKSDFPATLPVLRAVTSRSYSSVNPSGADLISIAQKLNSIDESSLDYWPTVLQFLKFYSESHSANVPPPDAGGINVGSSATGFQLDGVNLQYFVLRLNATGTVIKNSVFSNSRIVFSNNPVELINVKFIDCVFDLTDLLYQVEC